MPLFNHRNICITEAPGCHQCHIFRKTEMFCNAAATWLILFLFPFPMRTPTTTTTQQINLREWWSMLLACDRAYIKNWCQCSSSAAGVSSRWDCPEVQRGTCARQVLLVLSCLIPAPDRCWERTGTIFPQITVKEGEIALRCNLLQHYKTREESPGERTVGKAHGHLQRAVPKASPSAECAGASAGCRGRFELLSQGWNTQHAHTGTRTDLLAHAPSHMLQSKLCLCELLQIKLALQ